MPLRLGGLFGFFKLINRRMSAHREVLRRKKWQEWGGVREMSERHLGKAGSVAPPAFPRPDTLL